MVSTPPGLPPSMPPDLDPVAIAVYLQVLRDGELRPVVAAAAAGVSAAEVERTCEQLIENHLLSPNPLDPKRLVPNSPEIAAARLIEPVDELIRTYRKAAEVTRERFSQLMPAFLARSEGGQGDHGRLLETVADAQDVQLLVVEEVQRCSSDLMTVQPGGARGPAALEDSLPHDLAALARGVRLRALYQHTTRASLHNATYVAAVSEAGGQVRTTEQIAERMFIFDRKTAFIPKWVHPDRVPGAVIVREPVLVAFLCSFFEQMWLTAAPYVPNAPGYQEVSDELRRSVIRLLAQGFKDEVVARKLGMSVRTCRRHIASIMQALGAESRFEAGVKAAQLGMLELDVE